MKSEFAFDLANLQSAKLSADPVVFVNALIQEEARVCAPIDRRITEMEREFHRLAMEYKSLEKEYQRTEGFWKRLSVKSKIKACYKRLATVRSLMETLYMERWRNTYG